MITANETRNPLLLEVKNLKVWFEIKQKKTVVLATGREPESGRWCEF